MGKRKKQRAAKRRGLTEEQRLRHRARARAELLYDPGTEPELAAEILRELFRGVPVDPDMAASIGSRGGMDRLRAVAGAALAHGQDPATLSLAADVALMDGRAEEAERHAARALELVDDPDLHLRRALALADQGRVAAAHDVLDAQLRADPGLEALQLARLRLLRDAEAPLVDRFLDRTPVEELRAAMDRYTGSGADGLEDWVEAGAIGEDEVPGLRERAAADPGSPEARRLRWIAEWAWLMPVLPDERAPLEALAGDEAAPADLRRRAEDWLSWAVWGLWEVDRSEAGPGVVLRDLATGVRLYAEVPDELLAALPRWSVLVGHMVPVDGVWRAGSDFEVASPIEARVMLHELLDDVLASADELGREGRPVLAWARRVHDLLGPLWLPEAAEPPVPEAMIGLQLTFRAFAPHLVAGLRAMRGTSPLETSSGAFGLTLDDPDAAWEALAAHDEFEPDEAGGLVWLTDDEARACLERTEEGGIVVDTDPDEVAALLDLLRGLRHPATADELPAESPEAPIGLPDLQAADLRAWLEALPDTPLDELDGMSPREGAGWEAEMLVRYVEHDADRRGVELDTAALRAELARKKQ